ncbi:uncharacterized protein [Dermacentor albipictus]|uniref:uncharacterized protein n=1 Tax=Dermacentor albipictus TaxID=60249 RepID=UPI0038FC69BF
MADNSGRAAAMRVQNSTPNVDFGPTYSCKHGGRSHKSVSTGVRPKQTFPEIVFVDAIHKTNDKRMPLYVVLVEDSNGKSQTVALILCAGEDEATLQALFSRFNVNNRSTTDTNVIMIDL